MRHLLTILSLFITSLAFAQIPQNINLNYDNAETSIITEDLCWSYNSIDSSITRFTYVDPVDSSSTILYYLDQEGTIVDITAGGTFEFGFCGCCGEEVASATRAWYHYPGNNNSYSLPLDTLAAYDLLTITMRHSTGLSPTLTLPEFPADSIFNGKTIVIHFEGSENADSIFVEAAGLSQLVQIDCYAKGKTTQSDTIISNQDNAPGPNLIVYHTSYQDDYVRQCELTSFTPESIPFAASDGELTQWNPGFQLIEDVSDPNSSNRFFQKIGPYESGRGGSLQVTASKRFFSLGNTRRAVKIDAFYNTEISEDTITMVLIEACTEGLGSAGFPTSSKNVNAALFAIPYRYNGNYMGLRKGAAGLLFTGEPGPALSTDYDYTENRQPIYFLMSGGLKEFVFTERDQPNQKWFAISENGFLESDFYQQEDNSALDAPTHPLYTNIGGKFRQAPFGKFQITNPATSTITSIETALDDIYGYTTSIIGVATNGSGDITVPHPLGTASINVNITITGTSLRHFTVHSKTAADFTVRFYDSSGTPLGAGTNMDFDVQAKKQ